MNTNSSVYFAEWTPRERNDLQTVRDLPVTDVSYEYQNHDLDYEMEREELRQEMGISRKDQDDYEAMAEQSRENERQEQG